MRSFFQKIYKYIFDRVHHTFLYYYFFSEIIKKYIKSKRKMKVFGICMLNTNIKQCLDIICTLLKSSWFELYYRIKWRIFLSSCICKETCLTHMSGKVKMPALLSSFFAKKTLTLHSLDMPNNTHCFEFATKCDYFE